MSYQDIWLGGRRVAEGQRECASRYDAVSKFLAQYWRPFTVLDLGASEGYFSLRTAEDYSDANVVAVEGGPQLERYCARAGAGVIALRYRVTAADLARLSTCEHFDVTLALNVLHHFGANWRAALDALLAVSSYVIVETPPPEDSGACGQGCIRPLHDFARSRSERTLTKTPSHVSPGVSRPMFLLRGRETPRLTRQYVDVPGGVPFGDAVIRADFDSKTVELLRKGEKRPWLPGINLRTYQRFGGIWPPAETVAERLRGVEVPEGHGDVRAWNFILGRGGRADLIDGFDSYARPGGDDRAALERVAAEIEELSKQSKEAAA